MYFQNDTFPNAEHEDLGFGHVDQTCFKSVNAVFYSDSFQSVFGSLAGGRLERLLGIFK